MLWSLVYTQLYILQFNVSLHVLVVTYGLPSLCVCSVQKLLRRAEEEKSELSLHIAAQEKQFKGLWGGDACLQ